MMLKILGWIGLVMIKDLKNGMKLKRMINVSKRSILKIMPKNLKIKPKN